MSRTNAGPVTYVARLHPWAAKFNLRPHLSNVILANLLSGDTCEPISLTDFEKYLIYNEHSVENLQFVVWFQDYRKRFFDMPQSAQKSSPGPSDFTFAAPSSAEIELREIRSLSKATHSKALTDSPDEGSGVSGTVPNISPPEAVSTSTTSPSQPLPAGTDPLSHRDDSPGQNEPPISNIPKLDPPEKQPMRTECMRIITTFLRPGAPKELTLDATVRDTVIRNLTSSFHPDVHSQFLPVYEEAYNMLERISLPRFLAFATANINLPKQIFWYAVGFTDISISLAISLSLIMMVPTPPQSNRAWRLFALVFAWLGSMQFYSAWRGFCNQVWLRGNVQLRVWEIEDVDDEANMFVDRVLEPAVTEEPQQNLGQESNADGSLNKDHGPTHVAIPEAGTSKDKSAIAPFASHDDEPTDPQRQSKTPPLPSTNDDTLPKQTHFHRPPIFGPERVVQDPLIKAVHQQVMNDILHVGFWYTLCFSILIFSVPSRI